MEKCEYLTGKDLGNNPGVVEQTKFEYSPLGKSFINKAVELDDKKKGSKKKNIIKSDYGLKTADIPSLKSIKLDEEDIRGSERRKILKRLASLNN